MAVRAQINGNLEPEEQFRATLDQALTQLQGEVCLIFSFKLAKLSTDKHLQAMRAASLYWVLAYFDSFTLQGLYPVRV